MRPHLQSIGLGFNYLWIIQLFSPVPLVQAGLFLVNNYSLSQRKCQFAGANRLIARLRLFLGCASPPTGAVPIKIYRQRWIAWESRGGISPNLAPLLCFGARLRLEAFDSRPLEPQTSLITSLFLPLRSSAQTAVRLVPA